MFTKICWLLDFNPFHRVLEMTTAPLTARHIQWPKSFVNFGFNFLGFILRSQMSVAMNGSISPHSLYKMNDLNGKRFTRHRDFKSKRRLPSRRVARTTYDLF